MRLFLLCFALFHFCTALHAQLIVTPAFHQNTLVNSPAAVGALQQEGIKMNTFANRGFRDLSFTTGPSIFALLSNSLGELDLFSVKQFNALSYHNTQTLPNNYKITFGLQIQTTRSILATITNPNTYGITANLHIPLASDEGKDRFFSVGMQMNLIHQNPNKTATAHIYNNLLEDPRLEYNTFNKQFSRAGFQYRLAINYLRHKHEKSIFAAGFTLGLIQTKTPRFFGFGQTETFSFSSSTNNQIAIYFNYQIAPGKKAMLDFNLSANKVDEFNISLGAGFRMKKNTILRITILQGQNFNFRNRGLTLGIDHSRFSYYLSYGTIQPTGRDDVTNKLLELGADFKISGSKKPSLLQLKY